MDVVAATLYCVATPIGNLGDLTVRATQVLEQVHTVYAEDTRVTQHLLTHLGLQKPLVSLHDFNETQRIQSVLDALASGHSLALVSDAGTPLISDPGYKLVRAVAQAGFNLVPIPGASAVITALSVAGLPTDRFSFEGFLPAKASARIKALEALKSDARTLVFYESCHRIEETLTALATVFGVEREVVIGREMTKAYETFYRGTLGALAQGVGLDDNLKRGELVVIVAGNSDEDTEHAALAADTVLKVLLDEGLPVKQATSIAARLTGQAKNELYRLALSLSRSD
ncbi:16S rRNA (cytidine(1402)-2'-O)-methyltransferase [Thiofilum flexile]|uniref:16S rRNA (cytidine(1402)-2'-O)-methyltransferase n=1 Tax=Thiofilum flexile TaxID=125627 RepID=UPI00036DCB8F|nr:16S rRNA (cytidine(1402)-2'-O)-methyltransferase [Thiofilum flexile]